jgi:hypothetical protein
MWLSFRFLHAGLMLAVPFCCLAADDSPPVCNSVNQGRMWPDSANRDPKLIPNLARCGALLVCVHGSWHYHWEAPGVRLDQLARRRKSKAIAAPACEVQSAAGVPAPEPSISSGN